MNKSYGFTLEPGRDGGFWWTVREGNGTIRGIGFDATRRLAEQAARERIDELMARKAAA